MAASSSVAHVICVIYVFNKLSQIVRNETTNGNNRIGDIELILFIKWIKILSRFVQWIGMLKCRSKADIQNQTTDIQNRLLCVCNLHPLLRSFAMIFVSKYLVAKGDYNHYFSSYWQSGLYKHKTFHIQTCDGFSWNINSVNHRAVHLKSFQCSTFFLIYFWSTSGY